MDDTVKQVTGLWQQVQEFFAKAAGDAALKVVGALVVLVLGFFLVKMLMRVLERSFKNSKIDKNILAFALRVISVSLKVLLVVTAAIYLGVPQASFIALLSSIGLAVGLALQGSFSNFAGGVMILLLKPFRVGDYITGGNVEGTVKDIGIIYTVLQTFDGKKVVAPNSLLSNAVITDFSWNQTRRVDVKVVVATEEDINQVRSVMLNACQGHPLVLADPAPNSKLTGFEDNGMMFALRVWCKTEDYWDVMFDLTEAVKHALDREGIALSYPKREIFIKEHVRES